jgi:S-DNA-T family DNA segregation ATPase FtsK/SpoIIIE
VRPAIDEDPDAFWKRAAATGTDSNNLLLVDDADLLSRDTHRLLAGMLATGARAVFACSPSPTVAGLPALVGLRANPLGIVLGPRSATDGDIFGLRLDVDGKPPPGRGVLVDSGRSVEIQVAKVRGRHSE